MKKNNKGFTMAELLIVVAIIGVLVAVAIPTFVDQLEKAREATDISNVRDVYSEISVAFADGTLSKTGDTVKVLKGLTATYTVTTGESASIKVEVPSFPIEQKVAGWQSGTTIDIAGGVTLAAPTAIPEGGTMTLTFTYTQDAAAANHGTQTYLSTVALSSAT